MYRLSSLHDRIRFEESARARVREYLRDEDIPVWQIDPIELAHRVIARENLLLATDDPDKAKAYYIDACRLEHAKMLRDAIMAHRGDDVEHVRPVRLLLMPPDSLGELGNIAEYFDSKCPDGDLLLALTSHFRRADLAVALDAGAKVVHGYEFAYPSSVNDDPGLPRGWCGYRTKNEGYALQRDVATVVWAASVTRKIKQNNGDLSYVISQCV